MAIDSMGALDRETAAPDTRSHPHRSPLSWDSIYRQPVQYLKEVGSSPILTRIERRLESAGTVGLGTVDPSDRSDE
jgi:hypothetical protein